MEYNFKFHLEHIFATNKDYKQLKINIDKLIEDSVIKNVKIVFYDTGEALYKTKNAVAINKTLMHTFIVRINNVKYNNKLIKVIICSNNTVVVNKIKNTIVQDVVSFIIEIIVLWGLLLWVGVNFFLKNTKITLAEIYLPAIIAQSNFFSSLLTGKSFSQKTIKRNKKTVHKDEEYKDLEQYIVDISNLIPSAIINIDRECLILYLNQAAEKFLGCNIKETVGKPIQSIIVELEPYMELIKFALEKKQFKTFNRIKITVNNNEHFLKIVAYPFKSIGIALYIDDITEQVFRENLLVQNEKMTTLGMLAAGMAHEINNPLSGILQSVQNISRRLEPKNPKNLAIANEYGISIEQVNKYLEVRDIYKFLAGIKELGTHAAFVVKNVLKFSRRSNEEMIQVNANGIVQDALSIITTDYDIKKQLSYHKLTITTKLDDNLPNIFCSPSEIEQVVLNLIKNASQALAEKEFHEEQPVIMICTKNMGDHITIEITDNGPGIPEQVMEHLFKPFFTTKPIGVGTGLGLSISHYIIIDKHHGKLYVNSTVGTGTTFVIELLTSVLADDDACVEKNA